MKQLLYQVFRLLLKDLALKQVHLNMSEISVDILWFRFSLYKTLFRLSHFHL